jgi:type II secretion system protein J
MHLGLQFNHARRRRRALAPGGGTLAGRAAAAGFTLLELLLATAIGAIVLLVINVTFFAALRLHNTTHEKIDQDLVLQRALGIMRKDLAGIMVPGNPQATTPKLAGQLVSDGSGTANDMDAAGERVSPDIYTSSGRIDGWTSFADVQMVSYYLASDPDGGPTKSLVRVLTRNLLPATDPTTEDQTLLTGVTSAAMSFFDGSDWLDTWDSTTTSTLPTAIKFTLVMAPHDNVATRIDPGPIELIVPVLVTTTTSAQDAAAATAATP